MPISKSGKAYFTDEQYQEARYNSSALEYARSHGYQLSRVGSSYWTMEEHDSMRFSDKTGIWYWNSRGVSGGALEFAMYFEGKSIVEAVLEITGDRQLSRSEPVNPQPQKKIEPLQADTAPMVFTLPTKAGNQKQLWAYLCQTRGLERDVVDTLISEGLVYESERITANGKVNNATFVYKAPDGSAVGAFNRGMYTLQPGQKAYKRDVACSDKSYGWCIPAPENSKSVTLRVFEGAIDAASDASIDAIINPDWRNEPISRLSMEGLQAAPVYKYLEAHPEAQKVVIKTDNDKPGKEFAVTLKQKLKESYPQIRVYIETPPVEYGKDWNEALLHLRHGGEEKANTENIEKKPATVEQKEVISQPKLKKPLPPKWETAPSNAERMQALEFQIITNTKEIENRTRGLPYIDSAVDEKREKQMIDLLISKTDAMKKLRQEWLNQGYGANSWADKYPDERLSFIKVDDELVLDTFVITSASTKELKQRKKELDALEKQLNKKHIIPASWLELRKPKKDYQINGQQVKLDYSDIFGYNNYLRDERSEVNQQIIQRSNKEIDNGFGL